jgi:hypothetical protein
MRSIALFILVLTFGACSGEIKLPDAPRDLIPKDSMVVLLKDMTILESAVQNRYSNVTVFYKVMTSSGKAYLKEKNITPERYERSFDYYVVHDAELQEICTEIMDSLTRESENLQNQ